MTSTPAAVRLYEITLANGRSSSPFVWRIRYALAHKGLTADLVPLAFLDIPKTLGGKFKTVPILEHGGTALAESWDIAEYLERAFPGTPPLFSSLAEMATVRLFDTWFSVEVMKRMFGIYVLDIHDAARPDDRAYFRESREARFFKGATLEMITAERNAKLPALHEALLPLRLHLKRYPFLGGLTPNYADYIALGAFQWVASIATLAPLAKDDDVLRGWLDRGFDLFGGVGRDPRMHPLFEA